MYITIITGDSHMNISELYTPAVLLDLDAAENNIRKYCLAARKHGKQIWPMIKTHKCTELIRLQMEAGCTGVLCGTLDEAEASCSLGVSNIMYAYPVATETSVRRVIKLCRKAERFLIRLDSLEAAEIISRFASAEGVVIDYTIIIDSGLHRFGVSPKDAADLFTALQEYPGLHFCGISTHPGHVYAAEHPEDVVRYAFEEKAAVKTAADSLSAIGVKCEIISSGSTPTFLQTIDDPYIGVYHPGNYIFNDAIQLSTDTASEEECALTVLASVIAHPRDDLFICDAGAKCLGLDQGAHGNGSVRGFGRIIGHPELCIDSLSEEVGKIHCVSRTTLKIGDRIRIIPNHSCSTANLTGWYTGCRGDSVEKDLSVDIRGNSVSKIPVLS